MCIPTLKEEGHFVKMKQKLWRNNAVVSLSVDLKKLVFAPEATQGTTTSLVVELHYRLVKPNFTGSKRTNPFAL